MNQAFLVDANSLPLWYLCKFKIFFQVPFFLHFFFFFHILAADDARKEFNEAETASNDAEREIRFEDS